MADTGVNSTTISRTNSGFPAYLDFDVLRANSIDYLGNLTGKIWTDYNLHDPGITILEMLCYAVLDLGYRTQFPAADIFSTDPANPSADSGFFTPSKILTCNPLTILDYRKLLIDIEGVKNAWLEVADGPVNGLYHVYIELEDGQATDDEKDNIRDTVKEALMSHRNLCEDFEDISILCPFPLGVCADIELVAGADAQTVYRDMITALQEFFDPSPRWYTLEELLDKGRPIEDIFAGRPWNVTTSHGFVDTAELEALQMKKEIHLSDVYAVLFKITGVRNVRRLRLINCFNKADTIGWKLQLPGHHIPMLSTACSGLVMTQNGRTVQVNLAELNPFLDLSFNAGAKVLYTGEFPYLDAELPEGTYRRDLGDYYSIQNEFPRVYGIAQGGLPAGVTTQRKAQALQLKGYLFFFDQLLADYLSQLQNIRGLFSVTAPVGAGQTGGATPGQTYYLQEPSSVPDIASLIRFADGSDTGLALATPIDRTSLLAALSQTPVNLDTVANLLGTPFPFPSDDLRSVTMRQWMEDLSNANFTEDSGTDYSVNFQQMDKDCWAFFVLASPEKVALAGMGYFKDKGSARNAFESLRFLGRFPENYSNVRQLNGNLSFSIGSQLASYTDFLRQMVEDKALYRERRGQFLDHLLARFAEQFTDYALLSYPFMDAGQLEDAVLTKKQQFLSKYDRLSSGRGMGFNYSTRNRGDEAVSGFEKRVAALAGFNDACSAWLCNFVVDAAEEVYPVQVAIGNRVLFSAPGKIYSADRAQAERKALFTALSSAGNYAIFLDRDRQAHSLRVAYDDGKTAFFSGAGRVAKMEKIRAGLVRLFTVTPAENAIRVSQTVQRIIIRRTEGARNELFQSQTPYNSREEALAACKDIGAKIADPASWLGGGDIPYKRVYLDDKDPDHLRFLDLGAFAVTTAGNDPEKPERQVFILSDASGNFSFTSENFFDTAEAAEQQGLRSLILLAGATNIKLHPNRRREKYTLDLLDGTSVVARSAPYDTRQLASQAIAAINQWVSQHLYALSVEERPYRWKFDWWLDDADADEWKFSSVDGLESEEAARQGLKIFNEGLQGLSTQPADGKLLLVATDGHPVMECDVVDPAAVRPAVEEWLSFKKELVTLGARESPASFEKLAGAASAKAPGYVYRLVDKGHIQAVCIGMPAGDEATAQIQKKGLYEDPGQYDFPEICLGGDIFHHHNENWHYLIKSRKPLFSADEVVLFESIQGYPSEDEAQQAFDEQYLSLMRKAMSAENYGEGLRIGNIVVVPERTRHLIGGDALVIDALTLFAKKYPVRVITSGQADAAEFARRWPCAPPLYTDGGECNGTPIKKEYYYILTDKNGVEIWQSERRYPTAAEARSAFYFFLHLLYYPGNYIVRESFCRCGSAGDGDCPCAWEVCIREVLAESRLVYDSMEAAWAAVEPFTCVAESKDAFHAYFDDERCGYSYFISCRSANWMHPCRYDTVKQRNEARGKLITAIQDFYHSGKLPFLSQSDPGIILDIDGNELAKIWKNGQDKGICSNYLEIVHRLFHCPVFQENAGGLYLLDESGKILVQSIPVSISLAEWRQKLLVWAYYFPVVRNFDKKYCVRLRLPHFNHFGDDLADDQPCGCGKPKPGSNDCCLAAWESACCFTSCADALAWYFNEIGDLQTISDYRSVFYCDCGGFGIDLIPDDAIVAHNPQIYLTGDMDCAAIGRAACLLNAEGIHVVEHILLRPRCPEDQRDCEIWNKTCDNGMHCDKWEWHSGDKEDPCNNPEVEIPFIPGADPISFIATVALPSWPKRFRSKDNRLVIESLLQEEAPAHVLLRILWMTPKDLCAFEYRFRRWRNWLTWDALCMTEFHPCDFPTWLFTTPFQCPADCTACPPCPDAVPPPPCFADACDQPKQQVPFIVTDQINQVFCWAGGPCGETATPVPQPTDQNVSLPPGSPVAVLSGPPPAVPAGAIDEGIVDRRFTRYREGVRLILDSSGNEIAGQALAFLQAYPPNAADYAQIVDRIIQNQAGGPDRQKLTEAQQSMLGAAVTFYYMDAMIFQHKDTGLAAGIQAPLTELDRAGIRPDLRLWDEKEVKKARANVDLRKIHQLFT